MSRSAPLNSFRVRPRFTQVIDLPREVTREKILRSLADNSAGLAVKAFPEFIGIHLAEQERHYWSPRLMLSLYDWPEGGTLIEGTYGPEIEVWSVFLYGYLSTGLLGTLSAIYGGAQLFIGDEPWAFYLTGSMAVIALALYLAAQLGQKLGAVQTITLHDAYERAMPASPPRAGAAQRASP
ncbi:MAG: hypothetical protein C0518_11870 [Opitutus sp.]|nr:hypothetical protein [Opitutus sp.]